jgi:LAO/AO transport system kinase
MKPLTEQVLAGDRRALARLLTQIENEREGSADALAALFSATGRAHIVGITGAPGTGKSTLVTALAKALRTRERTLAVLAVDPTSPFSGGAILGDRIRMRDLHGDGGIFIRSMATRGSLGGLARAARDAVRVLDAAGFDYVLIETVGAGQSEVDIARIAQTTIVVEAPGMGDDVQAIKAGILEIADILVVNKADRPGADNTVRSLKMMLELGHPAARAQIMAHHGQMLRVETAPTQEPNAPLWLPPIVQTVAAESRGIDSLIDALDAHRAHLAADGRMAALESRQIEIELSERLRDALLKRMLHMLAPAQIAAVVGSVQSRQIAPHQAVETLLSGLDFNARGD